METNASPHDFAPSWLQLPTFSKSLDCNDEAIETVDRLSFRPHYFKKELNKRNCCTNSPNGRSVKTNTIQATNSNLGIENGETSNDIIAVQEAPIQAKFNSNHHCKTTSNYLNSRHNSVDPDGGDYCKYNASNNHSTGRYNRVKQQDPQNRPHSRHDFRNINGPQFHSHSRSNHFNGNESKYNATNASKLTSDDAIATNLDTASIKRTSNKNRLIDSNNFNKEFPSLVDEKAVNCIASNSSNVWDNVKNKVLSTSSKRITLVQRHVENNYLSEGRNETSDGSVNGINVNNNSSYYRNLVPVCKSKKSVGSGIINGLGGNSKVIPVLTSKSSANHITSPAMEIFVKNPKIRSNKSEFLKTLKYEKNDSFDVMGIHFDAKSYSGESEKKLLGEKMENKDLDGINCVNNISNVVIDDDNSHCGVQLSSSLEAEQRLLKEMGWKEDDDDDTFYAPLTDDEVKEFKDLMRNRNGFKRHTNLNFQLNFSPKKISPLALIYSPTGDNDDEDDETSSTSDDDDKNDDDI